jgi:hypothetical protein
VLPGGRIDDRSNNNRLTGWPIINNVETVKYYEIAKETLERSNPAVAKKVGLCLGLTMNARKIGWLLAPYAAEKARQVKGSPENYAQNVAEPEILAPPQKRGN